MWWLEILNTFNTLTLKQILLKTQTFFKKLEYRFLVESTKIENESFPYKTALSEANVKTNSLGCTKWTYQKERSFACNYFLFSKNLFQFKNLIQGVDLMYQPLKCPYSCFAKALEFYLREVFPCEYL